MRILVVLHSLVNFEPVLQFSAQFLERLREPITLLVVSHGEMDPKKLGSVLRKAEGIIGENSLRTIIRKGNILREIIQEVETGNYDLLIIKEIYVPRLFGSSTAVRIAERAACHVLIIKGMPKRIQRILLCDSFVDGTPLLSIVTAKLANLLEGDEEVTVLHVMSQISAAPGVPGRQLRASAKELMAEHSPEGELLNRDVQVLDQPGIHPTPKIRHGLVVDEILSETQSGGFDLVVVGAHPVSGNRRFLFDDVAHRIITKVEKPLLVVRRDDGFESD